MNPADIACRGLSPKRTSTCVLWWEGPQWLSCEMDSWPKQPKRNDQTSSVSKERKRTAFLASLYRATTSKQLMGDLPTHRVTPSRPFSVCGVDYAGPINILRYRGEVITSSPEHTNDDKLSLRSRWDIVQKMMLGFWRKWKMDYLSNLQNRTKWKSPNHNFKAGEIVIIKEDNIPPATWPLGFLSNKNPSSKILRWKLALEEFNYDIHYIRGSLNSVADHLSRCINNITIALPDSKDLIKMQHEDPVLSPIIQKIDQNDVSPQVSNYFINGEGLLCHLSKRPSRSPRSNTTRKQVCIPHCLKARILESVHSEYGGHLKFFKTYHRLSENFFWQNMYKDTKNFVRSCTVCLSRKNAFKIPPAPHQPVEQSQEPEETCHIDIFGPLKTTPKGFFDNYIVHRGCPHKLVVDNATYFKSSEFVEFCRVMGIHIKDTSSYSAHVNRRVEKPNQSLANILASISQNTNDWDEQLPHSMLALNSAIHETTYTSPFFLEHGRDIRLSYTYEKNSDTPQNKYEYVEKLLPSLEKVFNKVLNNLKDQEASHVDLSTRATKQHHYDYKIGSLCFIKTPNIKSNLSPKLRPKFEGPYRVIKRFSNVNYRVQHVEQLRKRFNTHVNRMIPFIKRFSYLHLNNLDDLQNQTRRRLRVLFQVHGII
ncbi:transposon Tf2-11 polyprotein [Trichonephila clavipes]|uniref:RNA-directed DNA polymerase n=1 Tax=Trichonephila clavipes TaxID=2585209 RepID=A0A8X6RII2_TRICX|nr:transposon Tf2-11 polyprotein [Trichonephila clavipes]